MFKKIITFTLLVTLLTVVSSMSIFAQAKLGDGRNLSFDKVNPDIRFKDGGNLQGTPEPPPTPEEATLERPIRHSRVERRARQTGKAASPEIGERPPSC